MNKDDKKALIAFKAMFVALSQSVKRKFENRANDRSAESGLPFIVLAGDQMDPNGDRRHAKAPPTLGSDRGTLYIPIDGIDGSTSRT